MADMSDSHTFFTESGFVFFIFFSFINRVFTFLKENIYLKGYLSCFRLYMGAEFQVILQFVCV